MRAIAARRALASSPRARDRPRRPHPPLESRLIDDYMVKSSLEYESRKTTRRSKRRRASVDFSRASFCALHRLRARLCTTTSRVAGFYVRARVARAATADGARAAVCVARRAAISTPSTRERCVEIIATRARRAARAARARRAGGWTSRDVAREGKRARGRSGETRGARGRSGRWARARRARGG